jgi:methionyl-tRNA formyltransferase
MRLNIDRVQLVGPGDVPAASGTVVYVSSRLLIATGDGILEILDLQAAGKRPMPSAEFLRGNRVAVGDRLGPQ